MGHVEVVVVVGRVEVVVVGRVKVVCLTAVGGSCKLVTINIRIIKKYKLKKKKNSHRAQTTQDTSFGPFLIGCWCWYWCISSLHHPLLLAAGGLVW